MAPNANGSWLLLGYIARSVETCLQVAYTIISPTLEVNRVGDTVRSGNKIVGDIRDHSAIRDIINSSSTVTHSVTAVAIISCSRLQVGIQPFLSYILIHRLML